jgi:hypothetical protein
MVMRRFAIGALACTLAGVGAGTVALIAAPAAAIAEGGFRCGTGRVVRNGETEDDVATKCGAPDAVRSWSETRRESSWVQGRAVEREIVIAYDEWEYDLGRHRLIRYVTFEQGRLIRVHTGSYGE